MKIKWPWKVQHVTDADKLRTAMAEDNATRREQRADEVHREITNIIVRNGLGEMFQASLLPKEGRK